jgi:hypothetical protein
MKAETAASYALQLSLQKRRITEHQIYKKEDKRDEQRKKEDQSGIRSMAINRSTSA